MSTTFLKDLAERVIRTFLAAFLTAAAASAATVTDWSTARAAGAAAAVAGVTAVIALVGRFVGSPDTASFIEGGS